MRLLAIAFLLLTGCGIVSLNGDAAARCTTAGGSCQLGRCPDGGPTGFAGIDCNPDRNPGGAVCCQN